MALQQRREGSVLSIRRDAGWSLLAELPGSPTALAYRASDGGIYAVGNDVHVVTPRGSVEKVASLGHGMWGAAWLGDELFVSD